MPSQTVLSRAKPNRAELCQAPARQAWSCAAPSCARLCQTVPRGAERCHGGLSCATSCQTKRCQGRCAMCMPEPCRAVPCRAWLTGPSVGRGQPGGSRGVPEPWEGAGSGGLRAGAACVPQPYSVLRGPRAVCCAASRQLFSPLLQLKRSTERSARVWVLQVPDHLPRP